MRAKFPMQRWEIVQWSTVIIGTIFALILLVYGINETSFRIAIRLTARTSCILFLLAFTASSWNKIKPTPLTRWLLQNRRYLGLSMAISHGYHALAIAGVAVLTSENMVRDQYAASLGYVFIILMTITSFKHPAAFIGQRNWRILHTVGMYYLWLAFTYAFSERLNESWFIYTPFVAILILAIILRLTFVKNKLQLKKE